MSFTVGETPSSAPARLSELLRTFFDKLDARLPQAERFTRYYREVSTPAGAARYLRKLQGLLAGGNVDLAGANVFDAGCGFGVASACMVLLGAKQVEAVETDLDCAEVGKQWIEHTGLPVHLFSGRVEEVPVAEGTIDVVLCVEAISHFRYPEQFLKECTRVMRRGGVLVVSDDNNGDNLKAVRELRQVYQRFELGPPGPVFDHTVRTPYVERRYEIIRSACPSMSEQDARKLALETSGMHKQEIVEAATKFIQTGTGPGRRYVPGTCPVEPLTNQYIENAIRPRDLQRQLTALNFQVDVPPYFGGETRGGVVRALNSIASRIPALLSFSPGYRVYARKQ